MIAHVFQLQKQGYLWGLYHCFSQTCLAELLGDTTKPLHGKQFMHILGVIYIERFLSQYQKIKVEKNTGITFFLFVPCFVEERNHFIQGIE